jgi:hypothetical protein
MIVELSRETGVNVESVRKYLREETERILREGKT